MKPFLLIFCIYLIINTAAYDCPYEVRSIWRRGKAGVPNPFQLSRQIESLEDAKIICDELYECKGVFVDSNPQTQQRFEMTFTEILGFDKNWSDITFYKKIRLCWICPFEMVSGSAYPECVQNCLSFSTLRDAKEACMQDINCFGVTYTNRQLEDSNSKESISDDWSYQLRKGESKVVSAFNETTWVKCYHNSTNSDINN